MRMKNFTDVGNVSTGLAQIAPSGIRAMIVAKFLLFHNQLKPNRLREFLRIVRQKPDFLLVLDHTST
jgi:hypothetical protein